MSGFDEEASAPRISRGNDVLHLRVIFRQLIAAFETQIRDPMLLIRSEVETNAAGMYTPDDLVSIDRKLAQAKTALRSLGDSFTP